MVWIVDRRRVSICRSNLVELLGLITCGVRGIGQVARLSGARAGVRLTRAFGSSRAAPGARMKTNLLKENMSIQFEGEPYSCTPRNLLIVVDDFVLFDLLDGLNNSLRRYFQCVLCTVDDTCASLHKNEGVASSDHVFLLYLKQCASSSPFVASSGAAS